MGAQAGQKFHVARSAAFIVLNDVVNGTLD
jgi:hypothetical protein